MRPPLNMSIWKTTWNMRQLQNIIWNIVNICWTYILCFPSRSEERYFQTKSNENKMMCSLTIPNPYFPKTIFLGRTRDDTRGYTTPHFGLPNTSCLWPPPGRPASTPAPPLWAGITTHHWERIGNLIFENITHTYQTRLHTSHCKLYNKHNYKTTLRPFRKWSLAY